MSITAESVEYFLSDHAVTRVAVDEADTSRQSFRVERGVIDIHPERARSLYGNAAPLPKLADFTGWLVVEVSSLSMDPDDFAHARVTGERLVNLGRLWLLAARLGNPWDSAEDVRLVGPSAEAPMERGALEDSK